MEDLEDLSEDEKDLGEEQLNTTKEEECWTYRKYRHMSWDYSQLICYLCHKTGHAAINCPSRSINIVTLKDHWEQEKPNILWVNNPFKQKPEFL